MPVVQENNLRHALRDADLRLGGEGYAGYAWRRFRDVDPAGRSMAGAAPADEHFRDRNVADREERVVEESAPYLGAPGLVRDLLLEVLVRELGRGLSS